MSERGLDGFVFLIFTCLAIVFGTRELIDIDLGWHLVGGFWILEHGIVPTVDPLGAQHPNTEHATSCLEDLQS